MRVVALVSILLCCLPAWSQDSDDSLIGEFHMSIEPPSNTHRFWKEGQQYMYAACINGKCDKPQLARQIDGKDLAGWFQPGDRWKSLGAKGITADGTGIALFHVDNPDEKVLQRTSTGYLFTFWIFTGSAERVKHE